MKTERFTDLYLRDNGDRTFTLFVQLCYDHPKYGRICVPAGERTDLASSPRILWAIVPPHGRYGRGAVPHDWLYRNLGRLPGWPRRLSRKECDGIFLDAMRDLGVRWSRRWAMYLGVRLFGWWTWFNYWLTDIGDDEDPPAPKPMDAAAQMGFIGFCLALMNEDYVRAGRAFRAARGWCDFGRFVRRGAMVGTAALAMCLATCVSVQACKDLGNGTRVCAETDFKRVRVVVDAR